MAVKKIKKIVEKLPAEPQTMEELLKATGYKLRGYKRGEVITGKIASITAREVLLDINSKTFATVAEKELSLLKDFVKTLKVGEEITVEVISSENEFGQVVVSLRKNINERRWEALIDAKEKDKEIAVKGLDTARGGLLIDYAGLRGFIPVSQLDPAYMSSPSQLKNKNINVKIIEVDIKLNRLIVSQKMVTQKELIEQQKKELAKIVIGSTYDAVISGNAPFGLFARVDNLEGLIHISEIAWEKVNNPADYYKTGDKVKVKVLGIEKDTGKLNLSIKQLVADPWVKSVSKYKQEQTIKGTVARVSQFGIFVQLEPGVEGLVHVSKLKTGKEMKEGDEITVIIENIEPAKRKISLTPLSVEKPIGYR